MRWTLAVAGLVHLLVAVAADQLWRRRGAPFRVTSEAAVTWVDVDTEPTATPPVPSLTEPVGPSLDASPVALTLRLRRVSIAHSAVERGVFTSPSAGERGGSWTLSVTARVPAVGPGPLVGDQVSDAVRAGIGATVAASHDTETPSLLAGQNARDVDLGLTAGGELVSVAKTAVHRSLIPTRSHGVLEFETDATGTLVKGRLLDASSGWREWELMATEIVTLMQGTPLRVASIGRGIVVTLDVTSALKTVGGADVAEKTTALSKVGSVVGAIMDPLGAVASRSAPPLRVVSSRLVAVRGR